MNNKDTGRLMALMKTKFPSMPAFKDDPSIKPAELEKLKALRIKTYNAFGVELSGFNYYDVEQALNRWCARCRFVPSANELRKETELFLDEITLRKRSFATLGMEYTGVGSQAWREEQERKYQDDQNRTG